VVGGCGIGTYAETRAVISSTPIRRVFTSPVQKALIVHRATGSVTSPSLRLPQRRTTHDARRTTHDARRTTHDAPRTPHDARCEATLRRSDCVVNVASHVPHDDRVRAWCSLRGCRCMLDAPQCHRLPLLHAPTLIRGGGSSGHHLRGGARDLSHVYIFLRCLRSSHMFTFLSRVYVPLTCLRSSHVFTFLSHVYVPLTCLRSSHVFTFLSRVYVPFTCLRSSHVFTFLSRVYIPLTCLHFIYGLGWISWGAGCQGCNGAGVLGCGHSNPKPSSLKPEPLTLCRKTLILNPKP